MSGSAGRAQKAAAPAAIRASGTPRKVPRVLIVLGTGGGWSRGILRGFVSAAHEQDWNVLHYHPTPNLDWLAREWKPDAIALGPEFHERWPAGLRARVMVSVNADRTAQGIGSVCLNEAQIARVALEHLLSKGLKNVTTFHFDDAPFAVARVQAFVHAAKRRGVIGVEGKDLGGPQHTAVEEPAAIIAWIRQLPKPCGVFAVCDSAAHLVARYARAAELRVPEDIAILGVDNDVIQCELTVPPLSSVVVPWQSVGRHAAELVWLGLGGKATADKRIAIDPGHVVARRSSDAMAIDDPLVARAARFIRDRSGQPLTVPLVAQAVATSRRRLERRFHAVLGRTVVQEIRRVRVELAKHMLATTAHNLAHIAKLCGFTNATLLNLAFHREVRLTPGVYRRRMRSVLQGDH